MPEQKTLPTGETFDTWLATLEPVRRREEAPILDQAFRRATGFEPQLWRGGIVGYGRYDYTYDSGHSGTSIATGFAPRKAKLSFYIMPGYADYGTILDRMGKHTLGKACVYVNKIADIDLDVLEELIRVGVGDLSKRWPVYPA